MGDRGKTETFNGHKRASGGEQNATRHGMQGGKLPRDCRHVENRVNSLRRQMEAAVLESKGQISILDAAAINSILKWERHGLLAAHWLRKEANVLSAGDRLRFSEAIAKASDKRDANIRALGLDRDESHDLLASLYRAPLLESGKAGGADNEDDDA